MRGRRTAGGAAARLLVVVGSVGVIASLFLDWTKADTFGVAQTGFEGLHRLDVVFVVLAAIAGSIAVIDAFISQRGLLPLTAAIGAWILGATMGGPIEGSFNGLAAGWYLAMVFAGAIVVGGVLALFTSASALEAN